MVLAALGVVGYGQLSKGDGSSVARVTVVGEDREDVVYGDTVELG